MSSLVNPSKHKSQQLRPKRLNQSQRLTNDHASSVLSTGSASLPAATPSWKSPDESTCRIPGCCGRTFNRTYDLARHLMRKKHRHAMASAAEETIRAAGVPKDLLESAQQRLRREISCEPCQQTFTRNDSLLKHLASAKHQRNVERMLSQPMMTPPPGYRWVLSPLPGLPVDNTGHVAVESPIASSGDPDPPLPAPSDDDPLFQSMFEPPRNNDPQSLQQPESVGYFAQSVAPSHPSWFQQPEPATASSSPFGLLINDSVQQPQPDLIAYSSPISLEMTYTPEDFSLNVALSELTDNNTLWQPLQQPPALVPGLFEESMESWFPS